MEIAEAVLDTALIGLLLTMAWATLHTQRMSAAIALFAGFGMVLALIWARLRAPDLALAEAAIGAGLTSALLLRAASITREETIRIPTSRLWLRWLFVTAVFAWLAVHVLALSTLDGGHSLPELVTGQTPNSGVRHPVTAVLLNFRAWDTLLELLVLLLALLGFRQIARHNRHPYDADHHPAPWPLLKAWSRSLAPLLVVTGGYLLWRGSDDPGGAFQAGAVLAAALVLLRLSGQLPVFRWSRWTVRLAALTGPALFLSVAIGSAVMGEGWLNYPDNASTLLIVLIESAATVSIAVTLAFLVAGEEEDIAE
ncbi:MAG: MnhB domain-containing protein [Pseudohongiellaceae bacterium]